MIYHPYSGPKGRPLESNAIGDSPIRLSALKPPFMVIQFFLDFLDFLDLCPLALINPNLPLRVK